MIDPQAVGVEGPAFEVPIELGKVREMARAAGSRQDAYLTDERAVVTPTFLKVAQFFWEPPDGSVVARIGFDPANPPLHAAQEFEFLGEPPRAGDRLRAVSRVESIEQRPSRRYGHTHHVTITTDFADASGRVVARARTTSVATPPVADR